VLLLNADDARRPEGAIVHWLGPREQVELEHTLDHHDNLQKERISSETDTRKKPLSSNFYFKTNSFGLKISSEEKTD